jgi:hypothetical protein
MKKTALPDFSGKVVVAYTVAGGSGEVLTDPHFEFQGGRLFLVGRVPRAGSSKDWSGGAQVAVAWDHVTEYLVFESAEDYQRRAAHLRRRL